MKNTVMHTLTWKLIYRYKMDGDLFSNHSRFCTTPFDLPLTLRRKSNSINAKNRTNLNKIQLPVCVITFPNFLKPPTPRTRRRPFFLCLHFYCSRKLPQSPPHHCHCRFFTASTSTTSRSPQLPNSIPAPLPQPLVPPPRGPAG
jgi:hypothetical protein